MTAGIEALYERGYSSCDRCSTRQPEKALEPDGKTSTGAEAWMCRDRAWCQARVVANNRPRGKR